MGAGLVEDLERVCARGFEVGTVFWGEVYSKDIQILGLAYGGTTYFDSQTTRVGPITHCGVWREVVGDKYGNAPRVGPSQGSFFADDRIVMVALFLYLLFCVGMGFGNANNIQAFGEVIKICVLDLRIITCSFVGIYINCAKLDTVVGQHGRQ